MLAGGSGAQTRAFTGGWERRQAAGLPGTRESKGKSSISKWKSETKGRWKGAFTRVIKGGEEQVVRVRPSLVSRLPVRVKVDSDPGLFSGHLPVGKLEPGPRLGTLSPASSRVIVTGLSGRRQSQPGPENKCPARALSRVGEISPGRALTRV